MKTEYPIKVKRLFDGKNWRLCIDQYGNRIYAKTVKQLRERRGGGKVSKIYRNTKSGTQHCGYVIGNQWFTIFAEVACESF